MRWQGKASKGTAGRERIWGMLTLVRQAAPAFTLVSLLAIDQPEAGAGG